VAAVGLSESHKTIFATATLSHAFINSAGASAYASIDFYQTNAPFPASYHKVGSPILWAKDVVTITFIVGCVAQYANEGFSSGANADAVFITTLWDG
jgi:hypothetical protein